MSRFEGIPGARRFFLIGVGVWVPVFLLIIILAPFYAHTHLWMPMVFAIAATGAAIGAPCVLLAQFRVFRHRRSSLSDSAEA